MKEESIIGVVAACIAIIGIILTYSQIYQTKKIKRAEFVSDLLKTIRSNNEITNIKYLFDYNNKWYNEKFHGSNVELHIDNYLSQLNYICFLKTKKLISYDEFEIFEYELDRSIKNEDCVCYLWNIYHWSKFNKKKCSFEFLIDYLKSKISHDELSIFENSDEKAGRYIRHLNFK